MAPNGKVFYANEEVKLKVAICWSGAGPTSLAANSATVRCLAPHAAVPRIMFLVKILHKVFPALPEYNQSRKD